jgi:hypothetical protein
MRASRIRASVRTGLSLEAVNLRWKEKGGVHPGYILRHFGNISILDFHMASMT